MLGFEWVVECRISLLFGLLSGLLFGFYGNGIGIAIEIDGVELGFDEWVVESRLSLLFLLGSWGKLGARVGNFAFTGSEGFLGFGVGAAHFGKGKI